MAADATWKEIDVPDVDLSNVAKLNETNVFTGKNSFNYMTYFNNPVSIQDPSRSTTPCGFIDLSTNQYGASIRVREPGSAPGRYDKGYIEISEDSISISTVDNELDEDSFIVISPVSVGPQYTAGVLRIYDNDTDYRKDPVLIDTRNKTINVTSDKAIADSNGDDISTTYLKKSEASTQYATINNPTFTGTVTVPKIVTSTGIEIY